MKSDLILLPSSHGFPGVRGNPIASILYPDAHLASDYRDLS